MASDSKGPGRRSPADGHLPLRHHDDATPTPLAWETGPLLLPTFQRPSIPAIREFIERQAGLPVTYTAVGARSGEPPSGYRMRQARIPLGRGAPAFDAARTALLSWEQFPRGWVEVCFPDVPIESGQVVAVLARRLGAWWLNACRIVSVVDEEGSGACFGFAYSTLPGHVATGEERFLVEWDPSDDTVWYDLSSFSRPNGWLAHLGSPYLQRTQGRFVRESVEAMRRAVERRQGCSAS